MSAIFDPASPVNLYHPGIKLLSQLYPTPGESGLLPISLHDCDNSLCVSHGELSPGPCFRLADEPEKVIGNLNVQGFYVYLEVPNQRSQKKEAQIGSNKGKNRRPIFYKCLKSRIKEGESRSDSLGKG